MKTSETRTMHEGFTPWLLGASIASRKAPMVPSFVVVSWTVYSGPGL